MMPRKSNFVDAKRSDKALETAARGILSHGTLLQLLLCFVWTSAFVPSESFSQINPQDNGPLLLSVSPLIAQRGKSLKVEARGNRLDGAYAVWLDDGGFAGRVLSVVEVKDEIKPRVRPSQQEIKPVPVFSAMLELQIKGDTRIGTHPLRLVSNRGVSNAIDFPVVDSAVTLESADPHRTVEQAQPATLPGFVSGKIAEPGEVDFYSFSAKRGQEFRFDIIEGQRLDPSAMPAFSAELAIYRASGSWFDPHRPTRLLFEEERSSDLMPVDSSGTFRCPEDGQYFLQVSGLFGQGCGDCTYQVRVFPAAIRSKAISETEPIRTEWLERSFDRQLTENRGKELESRSVAGSEGSAKQVPTGQAIAGGIATESERPQVNAMKRPSVVLETGAKDSSLHRGPIAIPTIIEGTIGSPGELDSFTIKVNAGQKVAFEVEAPDAKPPHFNPRIGVVDSQNRELFSNVERRLSMYNNNADPQVYLKAAQPKATHRFESAGEYVLQVRDITSRYGNPNYHYRILVRSQIPHVGEISVISTENPDATADVIRRGEVRRLNLRRGEPKRLIVIAAYEEGFTGDLAFTFTGLPEGVQAFPASHFNEGRAPLEVTQNPETIAPKQQKAAIVLVTSPEAPLTKEPRRVQLRCQPIGEGRLGTSLLVREFPLMVVAISTEGDDAKPPSSK